MRRFVKLFTESKPREEFKKNYDTDAEKAKVSVICEEYECVREKRECER